jgi:chaperonin cofactor prefoldin
MPPKTEKKAVKTPKASSAKLIEDNTDVDISICSPAPKQKEKNCEDPLQPTLDKHLKTCNAPDELHCILRNVSDKLSTLASKDFIESKFKEIITEKILSKKLKEVQSAIKAEVQKELENVNKRLKEVMDTVKTQEVIIEELRNKVSDLETKTETLGKQNETTVNKCEKLKEILYEREAKINSLDRIDLIIFYCLKHVHVT